MFRIILITFFVAFLQASLPQETPPKSNALFAASNPSQNNPFLFLDTKKPSPYKFQAEKRELSKKKQENKPKARKQTPKKPKTKTEKKPKTKKSKKLKHPLSYSNPPSYGPFFTGTFIYSKPKIPNFLPAKVNTNSNPVDLKQKEDKPSFDWEVGWKLGFGFNLNPDQLDLYTYWTSLSAKKTQTLDSTSYEIQTMVRFNEADLTATEFVNHSSSFVKFDLDSVDLELGKSFYAGKFVSLRPFLGLKWAHLKEEFIIFARTAQSSTDFPKYMQLPYHYNGIGLSFGLNSNFNLARHFAFIGNLSSALLYGKTKTTLTTIQNSGHLDQEKITLENEEWLLKPYVKIFAGFSFGGTLSRDRMFLGFQTGYQFELWLDPKTTISTLNEINSTLELSSFVAELRAEF